MTVLACEMAVAARDAHGSGQVAGSLGPIGFSYQPDKAPPAEQAAEIYADIARLHADYVDFHLLEKPPRFEHVKFQLDQFHSM